MKVEARVRPRLLPLLAMLGALVTPVAARPCGRVSRAGTVILVKGEEALIVWDEANHIEHFIRQAVFQGAPDDFGFLVPTPGRPTLTNADENLFWRLGVYYFTPPPAPPRGGSRTRSNSAGGAHSSVQVLSVQVVANMEATVLRASDPSDLANWLARRGYQNPPSLPRWLSHYTQGDWHVIAFRYLQVPANFGARAVDISFSTSRPMYPYSEPDDAPQPAGRILRVTVLANTRMQGRVGEHAWGAETGYAHRFRDTGEILEWVFPDAGSRPASLVHGPLWMTTFEESDSRRGADDLYFNAAAHQSEVGPHVRRRQITGDPTGLGELERGL